MCKLAADHIADDLHVAVGMLVESAMGSNVVIIENAQHTEIDILRVVIIRERKMEIGIGRVSVADVLFLSGSLALQRSSIRRLLPSVHPKFASAARNAASQDCAAESLSA